jgi:putative FmdB family regulatory protein
MPIYEYECAKCGHQLEIMQKMSDTPLTKCPKCKASKLAKLFSQTAVQFKGSGWYVTDYSAKSKPTETKPDNADKTDKTDKPDKSEKKEKKETTAATAGA